MNKEEKVIKIFETIMQQFSKDLAENVERIYPICLLVANVSTKGMPTLAPIVLPPKRIDTKLSEAIKKTVVAVEDENPIYGGMIIELDSENDKMLKGKLEIVGLGCVKVTDCINSVILERDVPTEYSSFLL